MEERYFQEIQLWCCWCCTIWWCSSSFDEG
jgi:hypothetical protein